MLKERFSEEYAMSRKTAVETSSSVYLHVIALGADISKCHFVVIRDINDTVFIQQGVEVERHSSPPCPKWYGFVPLEKMSQHDIVTLTTGSDDDIKRIIHNYQLEVFIGAL